MSEPQFSDKFIAFIDILGFRSAVRAAEAGQGRPLSDILKDLSELGRDKDREDIIADGPFLCPKSPHIRRDLDFQMTRGSDSVVVSAEVSPTGLLAVVHHCSKAYLRLLRRGALCRGYVTRGRDLSHEGLSSRVGFSEGDGARKGARLGVPTATR